MPSHTLALLVLSLLLPACAQRPPAEKPAAQPPQTAEQPTSPAPAPAKPSLSHQEGPGMADRPEVAIFISEMSRRHGFDSAELSAVFAQVTRQDAVLAAIAKPYEGKPWQFYKKLFLTDTRVQNGLEFRRLHAQALAAAERKYGVAPEIITAIIGVESAYGHKPGNYRVIDALATLAFDYPRRADYFRKELEQFLLLCRDERMDYLKPVGSYAGAMGMPQFMPSSYRKLAADGDGDGRRDIWENPADAIASVARYFHANGWRTGEPIASPARIDSTGFESLLEKNPSPKYTQEYLASLGISPELAVPGSLKAAPMRLEEETGPVYWLTFHNFNVIMRYNHSPLYAMAAYELSRRVMP